MQLVWWEWHQQKKEPFMITIMVLGSWDIPSSSSTPSVIASTSRCWQYVPGANRKHVTQRSYSSVTSCKSNWLLKNYSWIMVATSVIGPCKTLRHSFLCLAIGICNNPARCRFLKPGVHTSNFDILTSQLDHRELTRDRFLAQSVVIAADSPGKSGTASWEVSANHNTHRSHVTSKKMVKRISWITRSCGETCLACVGEGIVSKAGERGGTVVQLQRSIEAVESYWRGLRGASLGLDSIAMINLDHS